MKKFESLEFTCYLPVVSDFKFEEYPFEQRDFAISELMEILPLYNFQEILPYSETTSLKIEIVYDLPKGIGDYFGRSSILDSWLNFTLEISLLIGVDYSKVIIEGGTRKELTFEETRELTIAHIGNSLADIIFEHLIILQFSRPGSLKISKGVVIHNNNNIKITDTRRTSDLRFELESFNKINYSIINYLSFKEMWNWFKKNELLFPTEPKTKLQKAINTSTYIFDYSDEIEQLAYSMMALEILYTKGNVNIRQQLSEKIQVYLGPMKNYKDNIKKMYDVRSDFYHGALPIIAKHKYDIDSLDVYGNKLYDATGLAMFLLIGTIQKMYLDDITELDFEYRLRPKD